MAIEQIVANQKNENKSTGKVPEKMEVDDNNQVQNKSGSSLGASILSQSTSNNSAYVEIDLDVFYNKTSDVKKILKFKKPPNFDAICVRILDEWLNTDDDLNYLLHLAQEGVFKK